MDVGEAFLKFFMYRNRRRVKDAWVKLYCTKVEKAYIKACAKKSAKTVSDFLRLGALQGFTAKDRSLPQEVLGFQAQLAHLCGSLEVIGRKRLDEEDLNALDRAQLNEVRRELQEILLQLKNHLS
jgi:hypothetical protein